MIEEMLMDIAGQGYSPEDIKGAVIKVLQPFFDNSESLNQYACESQLLSAFEFFITPLYKFFNKKSIVQDFLMYNEFATTITKESDPVR